MAFENLQENNLGLLPVEIAWVQAGAAGSINITTGLASDGDWAGLVTSGIAGATLSFGNICYLDTATSKWVLANATSATTSGGVKVGMCLLATTDTNPTKILLFGNIRADAIFPTLTVGAPVYISDTVSGLLVTAQPVATDHVIRIMGFGNTANELYFCPSPDWITHI
jgi:hypothetical protein